MLPVSRRAASRSATGRSPAGGGPAEGGRWSFLVLSAICVLVAGAASGCGAASTGAESAAGATANELVGEAAIGSAHLPPGEVTMSPEASAFTPPETVECWRVASSTPLTREVMDRQATRLGMGEPRRYTFAGVSDPKRSLVYFGDADSFIFSEREWDEELAHKFEAGEEIPELTPEEAREKADSFLAETGFAEGLTLSTVGVKEALETPSRTCVLALVVAYEAGQTLDGRRVLAGREVWAPASASVVVSADGRIVRFAHSGQGAVPAESVKLRPVAAALDDLRAGLGQCPAHATRESLSRVTVTSVDVAYYRPPAAVQEEYYKPVYVFHVSLADGTSGDWLLSAFDGG